MLIEFTKTNSIIHFIVGMVMSLVFRRYIYGSMIILFSILVAFQHAMIHSELELPPSVSSYTQIPAYVMLLIITGISLYILQTSAATDKDDKIINIAQLGAAIFSLIFIKFMQTQNDIFKGSYINYIYNIFLIGFLTSISIIKDNQVILKQLYLKQKYKGKTDKLRGLF